MLRLVFVIGFIALIPLWQKPPHQQHSQTHKPNNVASDIGNNKDGDAEGKTHPIEKCADTQIFNYQAQCDENKSQNQSGIHIFGWHITSDWVMAALTFALVILTLAYVLVTCWQVQTVRDTERAWIIVTPSEISPYLGFTPSEGAGGIERHLIGAYQRNTFSCAFKNTGNTPARLVEATLLYLKVSRLQDIPKEPEYSGEVTPFADFPLAKEDSISFMRYLKPDSILKKEEMDAVEEQKAYLYAFGRVVYRDVYNRTHENRFGYIYHFPQEGDPRLRGFRREFLPQGYNRAT